MLDMAVTSGVVTRAISATPGTSVFDDRVLAYVSNVTDDLRMLAQGTKYHGAAQEVEHIGRQLDSFRWELQPRLSEVHPVIAALDAHGRALDGIVEAIRSKGGYHDPWTPTRSQSAELLGIHEYVLGIETAHMQGALRSPLEDLREVLLGNGPLRPELVPIRDQTLALIDRNIGRMQGITPEGAPQGYLDHPDYAEIGRIRANVTLIQEASVAVQAAERLAW